MAAAADRPPPARDNGPVATGGVTVAIGCSGGTPSVPLLPVPFALPLLLLSPSPTPLESSSAAGAAGPVAGHGVVVVPAVIQPEDQRPRGRVPRLDARNQPPMKRRVRLKEASRQSIESVRRRE